MMKHAFFIMAHRYCLGLAPLNKPLRSATLRSLSTLAPGCTVQILATGELGTVSANLRGGWWSVYVNDMKKKLRARDVSIVENSDASLNDNLDVSTSTAINNSLEKLQAILPPVIDDEGILSEEVCLLHNADDVEDIADAERSKMPSKILLSDSSAVISQIAPYQLKFIEAPPPHMRVDDWVIFSDLHVKSASIEICEEVLDEVHREAMSRNAGIIFLGDFWHVRGALNVDLLNRILVHLSKWTQPVIMIPGNHDQVTLGGAVHALEPLKYAFLPEQILMISEPVVCMGALWIPYRRDHHLLKSILNAGALCPEVSTVYCHADVKGASMNDGMKSREGLDIDMFPPHIPIYSGHYHKPHTIRRGGTSLHYVGSPYQTSLSEANEKKYLHCIHCDKSKPGMFNWREVDRWRIDIGPKYFKVKSKDDAVFEKVKAGDKVVLSVKEGTDVFELTSAMAAKNVELELREEKTQLNTSYTSSESKNESISNDSLVVDPKQAFLDFMCINTTATGGGSDVEQEADAKLKSAIVKEGADTIERLLNSVGASSSKVTDGSRTYNLNLDRIELSGFGPYAKNVRYPLSKRGLVLIRGQASDTTGADSNGAGKTTLAMSVLWALTGTMDTRLVNDGKAVDVAHDCMSRHADKFGKAQASKGAVVKLYGNINNKPFEIVRKRSSKKSELSFKVDETDLTQQSTKDTQALIDENLGVGEGLLQRCCFLGQHSHTLQALLGLTDLRLKNELSLLVDMGIWVAAVQDIKLREKAAKLRTNEIAVEHRIRSEELRKEVTAIEAQRLALGKMLDEATALQKIVDSISAQNFSSQAESAEEVAKQIARLEDKAHIYRIDVLEVLRRRSEEASKAELEAFYKLDLKLADLKQTKSKLAYMFQTANNSFNTLISKSKQAKGQLDAAKISIGNFLRGFEAEITKLSTSEALRKHISHFKEELHKANMRLAECDIKISNTDESLTKLSAFRASCGHKSSGFIVHDDVACPTCGQALQEDSAVARSSRLTASLLSLKEERVKTNKALNSARVNLEALQNAVTLAEQIEMLTDRLLVLAGEIKSEEAGCNTKRDDLTALELEMAAISSERMAVEQSTREGELTRADEMSGAEAHLKSQLHELERLKNIIVPLRRAESDNVAVINIKRQQLAVLEERKSAYVDNISSREKNIALLEQGIDDLNREREALQFQTTVLDKTADVLGPRGVQHYIFMTVIRVLEAVANLYLEILADGGIQLRLHEDEEGDKIVKGVVIRGADGEFRERGLSQLSGGQWRRVSLALDLAFAEVIRRRGILRCSVIVMDEILTHLDASGREAVGSVLRALVQGPSSATEEDLTEEEHSNMKVFSRLLGGGAYETVIVILQDLAAQELEEAFDHIDTVVKEADSSRVIVDGGD